MFTSSELFFLIEERIKKKTLLFMDLFLNFLFQARKWPECATPLNGVTAISGKEGNGKCYFPDMQVGRLTHSEKG